MKKPSLILPMLGITAILIGLIPNFYFGQTLILNCHRATAHQAICQSQIYWHDTFPIDEAITYTEIDKAELIRKKSASVSRPTDVYYPTLRSKNHTATLNERFFNAETAEQTVAAINSLIAGDQPTLQIKPTPLGNFYLYFLVVSLPFILLGCLAIIKFIRDRKPTARRALG